MKLGLCVRVCMFFGWECEKRLSMASWSVAMNQDCLWKVSCISIFKEINSLNPLTHIRDQEKINLDLCHRHIISYYWILVSIHYLNPTEYP